MPLPGRPEPTTFEYLEAIALREPQRIALVQGQSMWTYGSVYSDLARVIHVLHELGVKRGDRVAVGTSGLQPGLLLLFASEHLGAATLSFLHQGDPDAQQVFAIVDWVFSDFAQDVPAPARFVPFDESFMNRLRAVDIAPTRPLPRAALRPEEPQRISRTSGSTGHSKFMVVTRHAQEHWVAGAKRVAAFTPESRVLIAGPLVLNGHFARAGACLRMGAAVLDVPPAALQGHEITHLCALPLMLQEILRAMPASYAPRQNVRVFTTGGALSQGLRQQALRVFGGPVTSRYGTNEAGSLCDDMDESGTGLLSPGADVRVVDAEGNDVAPGEFGIVCARTPELVAGYLGDPQAAQAAFRDGWFVSGDWGALVGPRMLRVAGRYDDLVNAGGLKIPAAQVEAEVRRLLQPTDCAVIAVNLDGGATTLGIAVVMPAGTSLPRDGLRHQIARDLRLGAPLGARVIFLEAIPRMHSGKVDRRALHRLIEQPPPGSL